MSRFRSGEPLVFAIATALTLIHALDDAFVHRGPGLGLSQHALAGAISIAAAVIAVLAFPGLRPGLRVAVAVAFGGLAIVNGMLHVIHISGHGAGGGDVTGALAVLGGAVLVGLAAAIPWRHRGAGAASPRRRWAKRILVGPAGLIVILFVLGPISAGIVATHKWREPVGSPPSAAYENVNFRASDGLDLAGWYRPSQNGAAVLVVHGGSSDRKGSVAHAELLARHGYGVLLYDARGRGESDGSENNYGWDWAKDIAGALDFGLSTGADALIEVAAKPGAIAALVADGAAAASFEDGKRLTGAGLATPATWLTFATIRVLSGDPPGPPLEDLIARVESPTLLISAGTGIERDFNVIYDEAARGPVEHWNLPDAHHTDAVYEQRPEYERRVVSFYDEALR
jgi:uncharacterized protein